MAKKKFKIKIWNDVEISVNSTDDLEPLLKVLEKAAKWERENKHLQVSTAYLYEHDYIIKQIRGQKTND